MAQIKLVSKRQREYAHRAIDAAPVNAVVNVNAPRRSNEQNAKLWAMLHDVARTQPEGRKWLPETWKAAFMHSLGHQCAFAEGLDGVRPVPRWVPLVAPHRRANAGYDRGDLRIRITAWRGMARGGALRLRGCRIVNVNLILKEPLEFGAKAACFLDGRNRTIWLPLSQIEFDYRASVGEMVDVEIQDWIYSKNKIHPVKAIGKGWTDGIARNPSNEDVEKRLEDALAAQKEFLESDRYYGGCEHEIHRLESLIFVIEQGVDFECHKDGLILVNRTFEYSLTSGKWRKVGKGIWYHSRSFDHFMTFVNGGT